MAWQGIVGHDHLVERFRRSLTHGRLATTFLFVGPEGIGKRTFALKLAQSLLCVESSEVDLDPCGRCAQCQQVLSDSHPDLQLIRKPDDRAFIPVETFIGDREHRMRTGLCHFISLTPAGGRRRIAIVDDADWLNQEGANSLLKTLEEPSPGALIILVSTSLQRQLPTIRSRSQVIQFRPLSESQVAECLLEQDLASDADEAALMAARSDGSVSLAVTASQPNIIEFRQQLFEELSREAIDRKGLSKLISGFMEESGKENAAKRRQLRIVATASMDFYRQLAKQLAGESGSANTDWQTAISRIVEHGGVSVDTAVAQIERCMDAMQQINSNANLGLLIDALVSDLAKMTRTGNPAVA